MADLEGTGGLPPGVFFCTEHRDEAMHAAAAAADAAAASRTSERTREDEDDLTADALTPGARQPGAEGLVGAAEGARGEPPSDRGPLSDARPVHALALPRHLLIRNAICASGSSAGAVAGAGAPLFEGAR